MNLLLQINTIEELKNDPTFWENYVWPIAVLVTGAVFGIIWNYFIRKKFKILVNRQHSFIAVFNDRDYLILNLNLINETSIPINNLTLRLQQNYDVLDGLYTTYPGGEPYPGLLTLPSIHNLFDNVIFDTPENIEPHSNLSGNLIIDIGSRENDLGQLTFEYLTKKI